MIRKLERLAVALMILSPALAAAVPNTIGFAARLADQGRPVNGSVSLVFSLWTVESAGDPAVDKIWEESKSLTASDGVVTAALGDVDPVGNPFPALSGAPVWLEVQVGAQVLTPRIAIQSAPYALRAGVADTALAANAADVCTTAANANALGGVGPAGYAAAAHSHAAQNAVVARSLAIPAGTCLGFEDGTACPAGFLASGAGCSSFTNNVIVTNQWINQGINSARCGFCNNTVGVANATIYTFCVRLAP